MRSNFGLTQSITREQVKKTRGSLTTTVSVIRGKREENDGSQIPPSQKEGPWLSGRRVKARFGEHPCSKLFDQISIKDEQLICYTFTGILNITLNTIYLFASAIKDGRRLVNL